MLPLLLWFVGEQGLAGIAAESQNPVLLSLFDPGAYPAVGRQYAQIAGQPDRVVALARPAVLSEPMNVRGVRILGIGLETIDRAQSTKVMRIAGTLGWRDTTTDLWVTQDAALRGDVGRVMDEIDALARRQVQPDLVYRLFFASLNDAPSRQAFADLLGRNPPWRGGFFAAARQRLAPQSYDDMTDFIDRLDRTPTPSSPADRMTFIDRMVDTGYGAKARAYWASRFSIPETALDQAPYDPAFHSIATRAESTFVSPFEWKLGPDADQVVGFQTDRGRSLLELTPGDENMLLMSQVEILPPGAHRIDVDFAQGSGQQAPAGWQVWCVTSNTPLIRSFATQGNELSGVTVTIPPTGCDTQKLTLVSISRINAQPVTIWSVTIH